MSELGLHSCVTVAADVSRLFKDINNAVLLGRMSGIQPRLEAATHRHRNLIDHFGGSMLVPRPRCLWSKSQFCRGSSFCKRTALYSFRIAARSSPRCAEWG